jgi:hypothetical protein
MAVYLVTWDLNKEKPNYEAAREKLISRLNQYETIRDPGLDSVRFVSSTYSADQLTNDLRTYMDSNDRIIVTRLNRGEHQGWLSKDVWNWINTRL